MEVLWALTQLGWRAQDLCVTIPTGLNSSASTEVEREDPIASRDGFHSLKLYHSDAEIEIFSKANLKN